MMSKVFGSGGGKGGGGAGGISESPDTLSSVAIARFVDLIGEGEIEGLVNGDASIYIDGVPLRNLDGTSNYLPFSSARTNGTQNQAPLPGFAGTSSETAVGVRVYHATPLIRSISDPDADAVRVTVSVNGLSLTSGDGKIGPTSVVYKIWIRVTSGSWVLGKLETIDGKTGANYQRSTTVSLTGLGVGPYEVKVERVTADSSSGLLVNNTFWDSYTTINYEPFSYPNSALVGVEIDGRYFSSVPSRGYHVRGLRVKVPSNYNPVTRVYTGAWDGNFVIAYTNNPAWCFYDLVTNPRYGLGKRISASQISKWEIYTIGKYCDGMVPTGLATNIFSTDPSSGYSAGGSAVVGVPVRWGPMEPRFTLNCVINTKADAYKVLNNLASVFRGMAYWSSGSVSVTQDSYKAPSIQWTNANVIDGMFNYEGSARSDRHTTVSVGWNNPEEDFKQCFEHVEDKDGIARYGIRHLEMEAFGCTSRWQARRVGLWLLYTERMEKDAIRFRAGLDSARVLPGDVGKILDANHAGARWGGRVISASTTEVTLDSPVTLSAGTYKLATITTGGSVVDQAVNIATGGTFSSLTVAVAYTTAPAPMSIWTLASTTVKPRLGRVISITPVGSHQFDIVCLECNPDKYNAIELGSSYKVPNYSFLSYNKVKAVTGLVAAEHSFTPPNSTVMQTVVDVSWDAFNDPSIRGYLVSSLTGSGRVNYPEQKDPFLSLLNVTPGDYTFYVKAVNSLGITGPTSSYFLPVLGVAGFTGDLNSSVASGGNLIRNPVFLDGDLSGWSINGHNLVGSYVSGYNFTNVDMWGGVFSLTGRGQAYLNILGSYGGSGNYLDVGGDGIAVKPGHWYQFQALVCVHRGEVGLHTRHYAHGSGTPSGYGGPFSGTANHTSTGGATGNDGTGDVASHYTRVWFTEQIPPGVDWVQPEIRLMQLPGSSSTFVFVSNVMYCEVAGPAVLAVPFDMGAAYAAAAAAAATADAAAAAADAAAADAAAAAAAVTASSAASAASTANTELANPPVAAISGGNLSAGSFSNGSHGYGSRTASASAGTAPYTYSWSIMLNECDNGYITINSPTSATTSFSGKGTNASLGARVKCTVTDARGRTSEASIYVSATHGTPI